PIRVLAAIGMIIVAALVLRHPESGVLMLFLLLPFLPTMVLVGLTLFVGLSLAIKVMLGKRVLTFTPVDATVLVFALFILFSGVVSRDARSSIPPTLVYLVTVCAYFIVKNLLCTPGIIRHAIRVSLFSMGIVSVLGIVEHYTGSALGSGWVDAEKFAYISGRAVSVFENPNVLGEYLILLLPMTVALIFESTRANAVFTSITAFLLGSACLVFTWSRGAWIGLAFALLLLCILSDHRTFSTVLLLSPLALLLVFAENTPVFSRLSFGDSSSAYRMGIWRGVLAMLKGSSVSGFGIGETVFVESYLPYAVGGADVAYHAHSLYLQIVCAMGIFGLIAFLVFCLFFTVRHLSYARVGTDRKGRALCLAMFAGVSAFLTQGLAEFVFYNYRVTLFFWMIVGLSVSYADYLQSREQDAITAYLIG
ncbi:MAG: O-antigen ligase family protein, partial [Ruminococcus sp.]|nr:O-antigen ligase family protein [Candidatus Apopatosoma intestinale]